MTHVVIRAKGWSQFSRLSVNPVEPGGLKLRQIWIRQSWASERKHTCVCVIIPRGCNIRPNIKSFFSFFLSFSLFLSSSCQKRFNPNFGTDLISSWPKVTLWANNWRELFYIIETTNYNENEMKKNLNTTFEEALLEVDIHLIGKIGLFIISYSRMGGIVGWTTKCHDEKQTRPNL